MEDLENSFASVVVALGLERALDYQIPPNLTGQLKVGMQVQVPIKNKLYPGIVAEIKKQTHVSHLRFIDSISPHATAVSPHLFALATWMARYYNSSLNKVMQTILPTAVRKEVGHKEQLLVKRTVSKKILQEACAGLREKHPAQAAILDELLLVEDGMLLSQLLEKAKVSKSPITTLEKKGFLTLLTTNPLRQSFTHNNYFKSEKKALNPEQSKALSTITTNLSSEKFQTYLLHGITGSGKTEIYLQAIEYALSKNKSTLLLVPEIALTEQLIEQLHSRFSHPISLLHHRLTEGERFDSWQRIANEPLSIVMGARSALFAPIQNLGLIIVDEEHEGAYKQSEGLTYHARDVAVMRGHLASATVILGSATPSLESRYNAEKKKYQLLTLSERAQGALLPTVHIVDMKREREKTKGPLLFSELLIEKLQEKLALGEQALLFLNRRGYHTSLTCDHCQQVVQCPSCSLALTFHRKENQLSCHLCDFRLSPLPTRCASCNSSEMLKYSGIGTEKVEGALRALLPEARVLRIDSDTTRHKGSLERLFTQFRTHKADILVGTQMIAKGLHFPAVTLVALLNGGGGLHVPDFRASEKSFQLITQVAGRAGRGVLPGEVILQTFLPDNETIQQGCSQDYNAFYQSEMALRKLFDYPPFSHLVKVTFSGKELALTEQTALHFREQLLKKLPANYLIYPLVPCGYAKIKEYFRFQFLVKGVQTQPICLALNQLKSDNLKVKITIDVDPISTFF